MDVAAVLFLLLGVVATSYAQVRPCCYPDQFEIDSATTLGIVYYGTGTVVYEFSQAAVDFTNKMAGDLSTIITADGQSTSYQQIYDFTAGVQYTIDPEKQECQRSPLKGPMVNCVPDNATFVGSAYIGDNKLTIDTYVDFVASQGSFGHSTTGVTQGDCIPTSVLFTGRVRRTPVLLVTGFVNYVEGIEDPDKYFTVPDICNEPTPKLSKDTRKFDTSAYKFFM